MSDTRQVYEQKTRAMFARVRGYVRDVVHIYTIKIAGRLIRETPGHERQWPDTTEYQPTGQLRGGWRVSDAPPGTATVWDGGPESDYGEETLAIITADILKGVPPIFYMVNNVAYGYLIQEGLGRHSQDRPGRDWVQEVKHWQQTFLNEAKQEAMR